MEDEIRRIVREEIDMWEARQLATLLETLDLPALDEATRGLPISRKMFEEIDRAVWGDIPTSGEPEPPAMGTDEAEQ